jgi:DNA-directed RNA polymerase specialized sigma24 family protein
MPGNSGNRDIKMQDDFRWNFFKARTSPHMRAVRVTSMWLTHNRRDAQDLAGEALLKTYGLWRPSISKANCRVLLFKVLTRLFFSGFQKRPENLFLNHKRNIIPNISLDRITSVYERPISTIRRTIIRLPVEIKFVNFLSKMEGFSPIEIGEIIGLNMDATPPRSNRSSRLLQIEPFIYSGQG